MLQSEGGQAPTPANYRGPLAPIATSILGIVAWLVFILLYALYWSKGYTLFQNLIVTVVSVLITGLLIGLIWIVWGFRGGWGRGRMGWWD